MCLWSPKIRVLSLIPSTIVFGGGLCEVICSSAAPMNGISVLIKRGGGMRFLPLLSTTSLRTQGKVAICKPGRGLSPDPGSVSTLILDFPASRAVRNTCLLFKLVKLWAVLPQQLVRTKTSAFFNLPWALGCRGPHRQTLLLLFSCSQWEKPAGDWRMGGGRDQVGSVPARPWVGSGWCPSAPATPRPFSLWVPEPSPSLPP